MIGKNFVPTPVDEKVAIIQSINCPECVNFAWSAGHEPTITIYGTAHHPACTFGQSRRRK